MPSERSPGRQSQVAEFQAVAKKITNERSAERFQAALKALVSPERTFRPPLRKTSRSRASVPVADQPASR